MPNWCENDLRIEGEKAVIENFLKSVKTDQSDFDFNKIIPYPKKFKDMDKIAAEWHKNNPKGEWDKAPKDGYNQGGYDWCCQHWGTKWPAGDVEIEVSYDEEIELHFNTAWSPPMPVILAASTKFPNLIFTLRYFEAGCAFNGYYQVENGNVKENRTGEYFGNRGG